MGRALLMSDEDIPDALVVPERVVKRQNHTARVTEDNLRPLLRQTFDNRLRAFHTAFPFLTESLNKSLSPLSVLFPTVVVKALST